MIPDLQHADLLLSRNGTWLSKTIRWFEAPLTQDNCAYYSHAACALGDLMKIPSVVEQLLWMKTQAIEKYEKQSIVVYRNKVVSHNTLERIATRMLSLSRRPYGGPNIVLNAGDSLASRMFRRPVFPFTNMFKSPPLLTCLQSYARCWYEETEEHAFGIPFWSATPDMADDWCKVDAAWEKIYEHEAEGCSA